MGALFDFKCAFDSKLVCVCQAYAEKCIFVWTILSQTLRHTPQVTYNAGRISAYIFLTVLQRTESAEKTRLSREVVFTLF